MKKTVFLLLLTLVFNNCKAQVSNVINLSDKDELNYIIANIYTNNILREDLYKGGLIITVFEISDTKATPDNYSPETDSVISSLIISVSPDGDYYTKSKLYKAEGFTNPKILEIKESQFPKILIRVEHGEAAKREIETLELEGVQ